MRPAMTSAWSSQHPQALVGPAAARTTSANPHSRCVGPAPLHHTSVGTASVRFGFASLPGPRVATIAAPAPGNSQTVRSAHSAPDKPCWSMLSFRYKLTTGITDGACPMRSTRPIHCSTCEGLPLLCLLGAHRQIAPEPRRTDCRANPDANGGPSRVGSYRMQWFHSMLAPKGDDTYWKCPKAPATPG
jgi:hypothetical protein